MDIRTTNAEQSLAQLADLLFQTDGSKAKTARAVAALRRANPQLSPDKELPAGTPVLVPPVGGLKPTPRSAPTPAAMKQNVDELRSALARVGEALAAARRENRREDQGMIDLMKENARALGTLGKDVPALLKGIADATKKRLAA